MNKLITGVLTASFMVVGAQAFADEMQGTPPEKLTITQQAMMKGCMDRMTAKNDGSSVDTMTIACRQELKDGTAPPAAQEEPKKY